MYYVAIVLLACIFAAEIAGICILIGKMRRARNEQPTAKKDEYDGSGGAGYAAAALFFGAVSATAQQILLLMAICAAAGALVLCALLIILCVKGYWLTPARKEQEEAQEPAAQQAAASVQVYDEAEEEAPVAEEDEALTPEEIYAEEEDAPVSEVIREMEVADEAELVEEFEEAQEETAEELAVEPVQAATAPAASVVESVQTIERTIMPEGVPAGQAPYVEKHIIETTKEVIKETNTTTVNTVNAAPEVKSEQFSPATEEMMKAITEFMKLETQLRMEKEMAVDRSAQATDASTPAFAEVEDEELEVEEHEEEDELDAEDEAQREADEENDDDYESDLFGGNERIVGFDEETGYYIVARYRKSCEAKLIQARPATKKYYSAIRNALMGYEGTKQRMSWSIETYNNEHTQIAKINIRPRTLDLYLALEPSTLEDSVYRGRDVSNKKKYAETPFLYKVNSPRKLTLALELVQRACEEQGLSPIDIEEVNYEEQYPFTDTETLIARGLIREYLREEKPAVTFELDPDHVPQLVEEDESVIPVNANFTWEFDNDAEPAAEIEPEMEPIVIEEEPVEEPAEENVPEVVEEPAPAAPIAGTTTTTTTHETIRTTERHYTERYYGVGANAQITEATRTIEVLPEAVEESAPAAVEAPAAEVTFEPAPEVVEEAAEEVAEETIEEMAEETDTQTDEVQSAVAALFGDDVNEEDEPIEEAPVAEEVIEEEPAEETVEEIVEEIVEEEVVEETVEEVVEEDIVEDEPVEDEIVEEEAEIEAEEIVEEVYEEEPEVEVEEEYYEEEPEAEEEVYYEEEAEAEVEEVYYEEEAEAEAEEVYYEEEPEAEAEEVYYEEEEYYEEEPETEVEEEYYEDYAEEAFEESYEEEVVEEVEEEEVPAPAPQPAPTTDVVLLDVCLFDDYFDNGAIVNLETLKQVGLAPESATRLKVYASGALKGQFTVEANHFTLDAIKAIGDADGDSIMIR